MAKKSKEGNPQTIKNVEQTLTSTEQFLESHYKELLIALGVVVVLIAIFWLGKIYLGKDRVLQREVAIKTIYTGAADPEVKQRFYREARALVRCVAEIRA